MKVVRQIAPKFGFEYFLILYYKQILNYKILILKIDTYIYLYDVYSIVVRQTTRKNQNGTQNTNKQGKYNQNNRGPSYIFKTALGNAYGTPAKIYEIEGLNLLTLFPGQPNLMSQVGTEKKLE